jgi:hypothetical protein
MPTLSLFLVEKTRYSTIHQTDIRGSEPHSHFVRPERSL